MVQSVGNNLAIFGFEQTSPRILDQVEKLLSEQLSSFFELISCNSTLLPIPANVFIPSRNQYSAHPFLLALNKQIPKGTTGLGLINLDLFVPRLNFIYGLAQRNGNALVALLRLDPLFYNLPQDNAIFLSRVLKECIHELGHVLGLDHCAGHCVMRFSNTLSDTDDKPESFCSSCIERIS
jgi:archaemetzincin